MTLLTKSPGYYCSKKIPHGHCVIFRICQWCSLAIPHFESNNTESNMKFHAQPQATSDRNSVCLTSVLYVSGGGKSPGLFLRSCVSKRPKHVCVMVWVISSSQPHSSWEEAGRNMLHLFDQWEARAGGGGPIRKWLSIRGSDCGRLPN